MVEAHGTRLVAVRKALVDQLKELAEFENIGLTYGFPRTFDGSDDALVYTRNGRATHSPASLRAGKTARHEDGRFELVIFTMTNDDRQEDVSDKATDLGTVVETFVAERRLNEIAVDGVQTLTVDGDLILTEFWRDGGGCGCELVIPVRYTARLV